ncbi:uncharacterized protein DUF4357 [Micromonospora endolithica]|nr:uncharacterized protein DUF4357 [Micromonospora endolithica]
MIDDELVIDGLRRKEPLRVRVVVDVADQPSAPAQPVGPPKGPLAPLMARGDLQVGERLYWRRPRLGKTFIAVVLASGELEINGRRYQSPSDAASACAGGAANGWTAWRRERDGTPLNKLR